MEKIYSAYICTDLKIRRNNLWELDFREEVVGFVETVDEGGLRREIRNYRLMLWLRKVIMAMQRKGRWDRREI